MTIKTIKQDMYLVVLNENEHTKVFTSPIDLKDLSNTPKGAWNNFLGSFTEKEWYVADGYRVAKVNVVATISEVLEK